MSAQAAAHTNAPWMHIFNASIVNDMVVRAVDNGYGAGDFLPTTLNIVQVLPTSSPSYSMTIRSNSISSETTTTITVTEVNTPPSQTLTSFVSVTSSTLPSSSTSSSSTSSSPTPSGTLLSQDIKTLSASPLNPGAIAGIVIACVFTFLVGILFATRVWFKRKRVSKLRKTWLRSGIVGIRYGTDMPETLYEPKTALRNENYRALALSVQIPSPHVSMPPISYNNDSVIQHVVLPVSSSPFTSPVYSAGLTFPSPYPTTVVCTFIPSLPDELSVCIGEMLRVLAEYEDGWSLCMNCWQKQGMVPNECLDRSSSSIGLLSAKSDYKILRRSTRVSSLAQGVRSGR